MNENSGVNMKLFSSTFHLFSFFIFILVSSSLIFAQLPQVVIPLTTPSVFIVNGTALGTCPYGYAIQNITGLGIQCAPINSSVNLINVAYTNQTNIFTDNQIINLNTAPPQSSLLGTGLSIRGADNGIVRVGTSSYGIAGMGAFANRHARGNATAPTAVQLNDVLASFEGWGYGATNYSQVARGFMRIYANATWNDTYQPTKIGFSISDTGTPTEKLLITDNLVQVNANLNISGNVSFRRAYYYGYYNATDNFINTANAQKMNLTNNNDVDRWLININSSQDIIFQQTGDYKCVVSPEFFQSSGASALVTFWMRKNGVDVAWSNSRYTVPNGAYSAPSINFAFDITNPATDYVSFYWWSDSTNTQLYSSGVLTLPARPSIPAVLIQCEKMSEVSE